MPIDAKKAGLAAKNYLTELMGGPLYGLSLEEVERSKDSSNWLITLSYNENVFLSTKTYKVFTVDALTGEVLSMKIKRMQPR